MQRPAGNDNMADGGDDMEIWQLRCFIALADTLSFSRAAESLYLSQSALSRRISELEKELGIPLFIRNTRRVELTEPGRVLKTAAKDIISRWEKVVPTLQNISHDQTELVAFSVGYDPRSLTDPARRLLITDAAYDIRQQHPGMRLLFKKGDYRDLVQMLLANTLDCALVLDRRVENRSDIERRILCREKMVLVFRARKEYMPEAYASIIMRRGLVVVDREAQGLHQIIHILSDLHLEPQLRFCEAFDDMTVSIETGESAAILPQSVVARLNNPALQVIPLPSAYADLELSVLWSKRQANPFLPEYIDILSSLLTPQDAGDKLSFS